MAEGLTESLAGPVDTETPPDTSEAVCQAVASPVTRLKSRGTPVWGWATLDMSERDQGDESPVWVKAAGEGQQRAAYLTRFYLDRDSIEIHELAALCEARQWEVRAARYVALHGGLLERVGAGKFRATAKGRRLVERGIDGHGIRKAIR